MSIKLGGFNILTIIFVIAKIVGKIDWSWWVVMSPTWIPLALLFCFLSLVGICKLFVK